MYNNDSEKMIIIKLVTSCRECRKMKKILLIFLMTLLIFIAVFHDPVRAHDISYFHVQQHIHEDGKEYGKLWITFEDGFLNENDISLFVNGEEVSISKIAFSSSNQILATYDVIDGLVNIRQHLKRGYSAIVDEPLIPGDVYRLECIDTDGEEYSGEFVFSSMTNLPIIPSSSFRYFFNENGDLNWSWDSLTDLNPQAFSLQAYIMGVNETEKDTISLIIDVPLNGGYVDIPSSVLDFAELIARGYVFRLHVVLYTSDHCNRYHSRRIVMRYYPEAEIVMPCTVGNDSIGLRSEMGTIDKLSAVSPETISEGVNRPEDLKLGLISMSISVPVAGTGKLTVFLPLSLPEKYRWYKYGENSGWQDYSEHAEFNADRDQVTLTFVDGGNGDDDEAANGVILDPSGPGTSPTSVYKSSGGSGGGCFIATAAFGSGMERGVQVLCQFRDAFLLTNPMGKVFVQFYYAHSPVAAKFIAKHEVLRALVRCCLLPVIIVCWLVLKLGYIPVLVIIFLTIVMTSVASTILLKSMRSRWLSLLDTASEFFTR